MHRGHVLLAWPTGLDFSQELIPRGRGLSRRGPSKGGHVRLEGLCKCHPETSTWRASRTMKLPQKGKFACVASENVSPCSPGRVGRTAPRHCPGIELASGAGRGGGGVSQVISDKDPLAQCLVHQTVSTCLLNGLGLAQVLLAHSHTLVWVRN